MKPQFASHNIVLPDGTQTAPGMPLVADAAACRAALRELGRHFADDVELLRPTLADLGCLEGGYAVEFARAGYNVTGFEAVPENYQAAAWLPQPLGLEYSLRFVRGDVRSTLAGTLFDAVFCSGLLYHLDEPVKFLTMLGTVTRHALVLNTHYSLPGGHSESVHHAGSYCDYGDNVHEGRRGHWYYEEVSRWSSFGNHRSFWLAKDELVPVLTEAGFREVREIADWRSCGQAGGQLHIPGGAGVYDDRTMFLAVK